MDLKNEASKNRPSIKKRKPRLKGWTLSEDGCIIHNMSGRWWYGEENLNKIGNFFIKASEWSKGNKENK
jgi:hypothetical protein